MAREYDLYLQLHELQPPHHHYQDHYQLPHFGPSASTVPPFELTAGAGAAGSSGGGAGGGGESASLHHLDTRKRKSTSHGGGEGACLPEDHAPPMPRKRKPSYSSACGTYDDCDDDSRSTRTLPDKKQNHSEIEKRRRDKMNTYIAELSGMVPMCRAMARKLDKLTVLRLAAGHVRAVRGALAACPLTAPPRPAFLSQREVNALVLRAAHDAFLLVVGCDRGRLLYVSASVAGLLNYDQSELLGQSLFDLLHPKDVAKVKEQLSASDLSPRERLIDAKTMLPVKTDVVSGTSRLCPGARRSFLCRVKCRPPAAATAAGAGAAASAVTIKQECEASASAASSGASAGKSRKKQPPEKKYCVVQCTGYLKSWAGTEAAACEGGGDESGDEGASPSCLVAVARALPPLAGLAGLAGPEAGPAPPSPSPPPTRRLQYVSRHTPDGKFLFVDQRVTLALGFLPQELLGTSLYEYVGGADLAGVARAHKVALQRAPTRTPPYSFRRKDGSYAQVHTHFKHFHNPWTKDVECLVANNTLVAGGGGGGARQCAPYDVFKQGEGGGGGAESDAEVQRLIDSQMESHKIGSAIAEEAMRHASPAFSPDLAADLAADLLHDAAFTQHASLVDTILGVVGAAPPSPSPHHVRNNVALSSAGAPGSPQPQPQPGPASSGGEGAEGAEGAGGAGSSPLAMDGNGEAAMAVIMNLLEADAGLGGPVNLSGLPWLLP